MAAGTGEDNGILRRRLVQVPPEWPPLFRQIVFGPAVTGDPLIGTQLFSLGLDTVVEIFERGEVSQLQVPARPAPDVLVRIVETGDDRFPAEVNPFGGPVVAGHGPFACGNNQAVFHCQGGVNGRTVPGGENLTICEKEINFRSGAASER